MAILERLFTRAATVPEKRMYTGVGFGMGNTYAGTAVTTESAMTTTAVYACVRIISETIASLPLHVYERMDRGKRKATEFPLYRLLHDAPNELMTSFEFREVVQAHLLLWGNGYVEIEYNDRGGITQMWPLIPANMHQIKRENGRTYYHYQRPDHTFEWIPGDRIWHLRGLGADGLYGYSPIALMRNAIGVSLATEEFAGRFFGSGAQPGGVLKHPGVLGDKAFDRIQESWGDRYGGLSNAHKTAILEEGMDYQQITIPPEDAQFLETRKFQITEIARMYRIPPHMLADLERATFSNIEQQSIDFVVNTIRPWLVRWEQSIQKNVMLSRYQVKYFAEFLVDGLLRGDAAARHATYAIGRQNGYYSVNDVLEMENRNPVPGGDIRHVGLNMVPLEQAQEAPAGGAQPASNEETPQNIDSAKGLNGAQINAAIDVLNGVLAKTVAPDVAVELLVSLGIDAAKAQKMVSDTLSGDLKVEGEAQRRYGLMPDVDIETRARVTAARRARLVGEFTPAFEDVFQRSVRREVADVKRQAKKTIGKDDLAGFLLWLDGYYEEHRAFMNKSMSPIFQAYRAAIVRAVQGELDDDTEIDLEGFTAAYLETYTGRYGEKQKKYLLSLIERTQAEEGDLLTAVEGQMDTWDQERAGQEANRETRRANNAIALIAYTALGVVVKRWATISDTCPYCQKLNGRTVAIGENFLNKGDAITAEGVSALPIGSNVGHPPAHDGCDCMIVAGV